MPRWRCLDDTIAEKEVLCKVKLLKETKAEVPGSVCSAIAELLAVMLVKTFAWFFRGDWIKEAAMPVNKGINSRLWCLQTSGSDVLRLEATGLILCDGIVWHLENQTKDSKPTLFLAQKFMFVQLDRVSKISNKWEGGKNY